MWSKQVVDQTEADGKHDRLGRRGRGVAGGRAYHVEDDQGTRGVDRQDCIRLIIIRIESTFAPLPCVPPPAVHDLHRILLLLLPELLLNPSAILVCKIGILRERSVR